MTEKEYNDVIGRIAVHYGVKAQTLQLCEECGELIQAVSKLTRCVTETRISALAEEIADVRIMMSQLMQLHGIPEAEVVALVEEKMKRQLARIIAEEKMERQLARIKEETR